MRPPRRSGAGRNPERRPCVYLLASRRNGTLYVGVTSDLIRRIWEHKNDLTEGFTKRYRVHTLVWYEVHDNMESAITREKAIKGRSEAQGLIMLLPFVACQLRPAWSL